MLLGPVTKQPAEIFPIAADFAKDLPAGETVQSATVTSVNRATGADSSTAMKQGAHTISGAQVTQVIKNGADGETHRFTFRATTTPSGHVFEHEIDVLVREV